MLSVGELPTVVRVLRDWRKEKYKMDPITQQLYREEFTKNKNDLIHPNLFDWLRDETSWAREEAEHKRLVALTTPDHPAPPSHLPGGNIHPAVANLNSAGGEEMAAESPEIAIADPDGESKSNKKRQTRSRDVFGEEGRGLQAREKGLRFVREEVLPLNPPALEDEGKRKGCSSLTQAMAERRQRERALELLIFICCTTGPSSPSNIPPIRIRVPEAATVEQVLEAARKKAADEAVQLHQDPQAYFLRMAEDDGTPDYDTPQLNAETEVKRFVTSHTKGFCIVDNPAFAKASAASSVRLIKVDMGDDQFQTFEVKDSKDLKVKDILWKVCAKSLMDYTQHVLHVVNSDEPLALDLAIADVPTNSLVLVRKERISKHRGSRSQSSLRPKARLGVGTSRKPKPTIFRSSSTILELKEPSDDEPEDREGPFPAKPSFTFWSEANAFRHKRYEVTKMSKFGIKQERFIGIDRDRITNTSKKKGGEPGGSQPTWKYIKNVVDAVVSETKPAQFTLLFGDDGKESESHTFDAMNAQEACEIVEKVKYCKNAL